MIWKNKKNTFAVKTINMTGFDNGYGLMIRLLPCLDIWFESAVVIGVSWLSWGFEFWFGDITDLI